MTPEQIEEMRVAIAEKCGWEVYERLSDTRRHEKHTKPHLFPSYPADLNAMHEAERLIIDAPDSIENDATRRNYRSELGKLTDQTHGRIWHATALQRAEAFCRVFKIGPFKE